MVRLHSGNTSPLVSTPTDIPTIISHAPSRPPQVLAKDVGQSPLLEDLATSIRSPRIQKSPRTGEQIAPSPTMFPFTKEIYGATPQPPLDQDVVPEVICPTPDPVRMSEILNQRVHKPIVSPLPSPSVISETPRLTEADAALIDIWFFRDAVPKKLTGRDEYDGDIREWKVLKQTSNELIPLTPPLPG